MAILAAKTWLIWIWGLYLKGGWARSPSMENAVGTRLMAEGTSSSQCHTPQKKNKIKGGFQG